MGASLDIDIQWYAVVSVMHFRGLGYLNCGLIALSV